MHFRPLPILTIATVLSLGLLITLGTWQIQRMSWKADLIVAYEGRGSVTSFQAALCGDHDGPFGPTVSAPAPLAGEELRYYALRDRPGWVRVGLIRAPRCAADDPQRYLFIESAFEDLVTGARTRPQTWRIDPLPERSNYGSRNDVDTNEWYIFDRVEMARALDVDPERVLSSWARSDYGMPQSLSRTPPAKHLGYALTWYGLAAALIGVFLALHIARGRLRWR